MAGRGRGRGGGPIGPVVTDDEGNRLEATGPPPLFPDITLPEKHEHDDRIEFLRGEQRKLLHFWQNSPYNLDAGKTADAVPVIAKVERWKDRHKAKLYVGTLAEYMSLTPVYFPEELYTAKDKRISAKSGANTSQQKYKDAADRSQRAQEERETRMSALLDAEERSKSMGGKGPGKQTEKDKEDEDEEPEPEAEEDDDLDEDDDYMQGAHVDDDEGYDDPYEDEDNQEAYFT